MLKNCGLQTTYTKQDIIENKDEILKPILNSKMGREYINRHLSNEEKSQIKNNLNALSYLSEIINTVSFSELANCLNLNSIANNNGNVIVSSQDASWSSYAYKAFDDNTSSY